MSSKTTLSINYQLRKRNHALVAKGFEKICKKVSAGSKKLKSQHNLRAVRLPSKRAKKTVAMNSTDEDSGSTSEADIQGKRTNYLERNSVTSSAQSTKAFPCGETTSLLKQIKIMELADKSGVRLKSDESFTESLSIPGQTIGGFIKYLSELHESRNALKVFTKANLVFDGGKSRISDEVEKVYTKQGRLYRGNYENLSELLANENFVLEKEHHKLEHEHLLKEMRRKDITHYHVNKRLTSHPFILSSYEILEIISEIVEIFDILNDEGIGRVERGNVSYLKERFLCDLASFKNWRSKFKTKYPTTKLLDSVPENITEDIVSLLRSLKDTESVLLLSMYCELFPDLLLSVYNFEVKLKYGSIKLWRHNLEAFPLVECQFLGDGKIIDYDW